jgi:hypothetical protein
MNTTNIITKIKYNYILLMNRLKAESPIFFTKLKKLMIKVVVSAVAVITVNATLSLNLNPELITGLTYVIAAGVAVYGTSILTTKS